MARRSLRPQLNQIRAWVRQGRTDAWIAHQLEVSAAELREFRSQHGLSAGEEEADSGEVDLRDEIEAEIEAATEAEAEAESEEAEEAEEPEPDGSEAEGRPRRRRRASELEASFDHGEKEGYGLWLDPAVRDDPVYAEHWAGHREVTVKIEADQIVIRRAGEEADGDEEDEED